METRKCVPLSI